MNEEIDPYQNTIDISYKNIDPPGWMKNAGNFCQVLLKNLGIKNWEVSLLFCDDTFIRKLNKKYRAKNSPTDVLAFSQGNESFPEVKGNNPSQVDEDKEFIQGIQSGKICAGDIVISIPTLINNADNYRINKEDELKRLIIHGVLHLMGMDHTGEGCDMLVLQEKLLKEIKGGSG